MSTEFFNDQWRIPSNENQNKVSNYSMEFGVPSSNTLSISPEVDLGINSTVSIWINKSVNSNAVLIGNSLVSNYLLYIEPTTIYVRINTIFKTFTNSMVFNQWYNIILVRNGDSIEVFQNGNSIVTLSGYGTTFTTKISTIGAKPAGNFGFVGLVDQVAFFDYALPATGTNSVATLYGDGTAVVNSLSLSPKPIAAYQLGDQSVDNGANYLVPNNSLQDYVFNFDNDRIDFANGSTIARQQNISYSAWINATSLSITQYVVGNNSSSNKGTSIFLLNDVLVFQFGDLANFNNQSYFDSRVSNLSNYVNANEWFHVAASWDGTDSKIYINGIERNSWTPTQPPTYTISGWSNNFIIGRRADTTSSSFYGKLSNIAFWNSGLTPAQVTTLYNNGSPNDISSLNPVSWWKLNSQDTFDGSNWTIKDYGSGDNDGTSNGMTSANLIVSDLQHTSGYSPYALSFDGVDDFLQVSNAEDLSFGTGDFTISAWIYPKTVSGFNVVYSHLGTNSPLTRSIYIGWLDDDLRFAVTHVASLTYANVITINEWQHVCVTRESGTVKIFKNGVLGNSSTIPDATGAGATVAIGSLQGASFSNSDISNVAVWKGSAINPVTLFNSGVPADLTSLNPSAWWQLGSNSSFNTNWTCLNEGSLTSLNAVSAGSMTNDNITNGVGYSANGLGTSLIDIVGDAPYSSGNGLSENMDVLDRVEDVPG